MKILRSFLFAIALSAFGMAILQVGIALGFAFPNNVIHRAMWFGSLVWAALTIKMFIAQFVAERVRPDPYVVRVVSVAIPLACATLTQLSIHSDRFISVSRWANVPISLWFALAMVRILTFFSEEADHPWDEISDPHSYGV